jgi:WD40 repeat protein
VGSPEGRVIKRAVPGAVARLITARAGDGRWLVLSCGGRTVRCWPAETADIADAPPLVRHAAEAPLLSFGLAFLPGGGDVVVARGRDDRLHRWERASWRPFPAQIRAPALRTPSAGRPLLAIADSIGGPAAVTSAAGGGLARWDIATGQRIGDVLGEEYGTVLALAAGTMPGLGPVVVSASGDGDRLRGDGLIGRWDPLSGTEIGEPIDVPLTTAIAIVPTSAGPAVCALGRDGRMYRHDLLTGEPLGEAVEAGWQPGRNGIPCLGLLAAVPGTGDGIVAASADRRSVRLWNVASGAPVGQLHDLAAARLEDLAAAQLPDGSPLIVTGHFGGQLQRFDARTGHPVGPPAEPHGTSAPQVVPAAADGRDILIAHGRDTIRLLDRGTGELVGGTWESAGGRMAVTAPPAGGLMLASARLGDPVLHDWPSGMTRGLPAPESYIIDVAAATLADGQVVIAGAGMDGNVYRWDGATGERVGEPLRGYGRRVSAITVARQADGAPMFVSGHEGGTLLRWDARSGERIGRPLPGTGSGVVDLTVVDLPDGQQLLVGLDGHGLYRWDPLTGESPAPAPIGEPGQFAAVHVGQDGVPVAFIYFPDEYDDLEEGRRVERWRLDKLARVEPDPPVTLRAVFDDAGTTWMVLSEVDGSLVIRPLPPLPADEPMPDGLW